MAKIEKVFNQCIERMMRGESMESCLASFPRHAAELEPLLRTALKVSWKAAEFEPRPGFQDLLRARLEGAQMYAQRERRQPAKHGGGFRLQGAWIPAMIAILAVIFSSVGTVAASSYAMPDQTLYPVKEATETVRLALAFSDTDKAKVNVKLAETRSEEIAVMASEGKTEEVGILTNKLTTHLQEAQLALSRIEEAGSTWEPVSLTEPEEILPPTYSANTTAEGQQGPSSQEGDNEPSEPEGEQPAVGPEAKPSLLPSADTSKKVTALKQQIESNISKNLGILETALNETPENTKAALQSAIDVSKENYTQIQQGLKNIENLPKYKPGSATNTGQHKNSDQHEDDTPANTPDNAGENGQDNALNEQEQNQNSNQEQSLNEEQEQEKNQNSTQTTTDNTTTPTQPPTTIKQGDNQHHHSK